MNLWKNETELKFFKDKLERGGSSKELFYKLKSGYYAYVLKKYDTEGQTLQSRNSSIGKYTEKWTKDIFTL
ncbi:MAG: hypothetical protein LBS81_00090 [Endomicrobium sp.]|jgi:hypothetical protein|nr:hypothetical protein [Endomicrobium sp.]